MADLRSFFGKEYESPINIGMMDYSFQFPHEDVIQYLRELIELPLSDFLHWVNDHVLPPIQISDIPQYSSFLDASSNFCNKLFDAGDNGYSYLQMGIILQGESEERKAGASIKYGENHSKTAELLGLAQIHYHTVYLSCIGNVFSDLSVDEQFSLLARLALRNRFFARIFADALDHPVYVEQYCRCLKESTMLRRKSNVMNIIKVVLDQASIEGESIVHPITFWLPKN